MVYSKWVVGAVGAALLVGSGFLIDRKAHSRGVADEKARQAELISELRVAADKLVVAANGEVHAAQLAAAKQSAKIVVATNEVRTERERYYANNPDVACDALPAGRVLQLERGLRAIASAAATSRAGPTNLVGD